MPRKANSLSVEEVRAVFRLVAECRDVGPDAAAWPEHLANGLFRLTAAACVLVAEHTPGGTRGFTPVGFHTFAGSIDPNRLAEYTALSMATDSPEHIALTRFWQLPGDHVTSHGRELVSDREWETDPYRHEMLLPFELDDGMLGRAPTADGTTLTLGLIGPAGRPRFGPHERALFELLHSELAPHLGRALAMTADPSARLTPRQRDVLNCLQEGDSEKQVAARLGMSAATVHVHVKRLYETFGVNSRAELLAYFLRRYRGRR